MITGVNILNFRLVYMTFEEYFVILGFDTGKFGSRGFEEMKLCTASTIYLCPKNSRSEKQTVVK